jgi:hypothetical protein
MLAGPMPAGGLALMRLRLIPDAGQPQEAVLQVNCAKGRLPENQQGDGIRLAIQGDGMKFDQKVGGRVVFILRKPGIGLLRRRSDPICFEPAAAELRQRSGSDS